MPLQLKNNKGFSLIELIASVAIISVAMLGVTTLLYVASAYSQSLTEEFQALSNSYRMEYEIRKRLSLAVHVVPARTQPYQGEVRTINCNLIANCPAWTEFAFFNRENSTGGLGGGLEAELKPTWFWYKGPVHTGNKFESESGVLVIDNGSDGAGVPDQNDTYFDQLTEFQTQTVSDVGGGLQRVKIRATFRYHGVTKVRSWCPYDDIVNNRCNFTTGDQANYYDNEYNFNVSLTNNLIRNNAGDGTPTEVRVLGPIHFFRPIYPSGTF